ncbi:MAG: YlxR family protein [Chloroflexi bacterium]|nr:YlxR family protein [Chloroflexota bacterium]
MSVPQRRSRHVPERTCFACQRKRAKWELVRIVRTPQGNLEIDSRGKKAGRGAYLCKLRGCWESGLIKKRLAHVLKTEISPEQRAELLEYGRAFPADAEGCSELSEKRLVNEA